MAVSAGFIMGDDPPVIHATGPRYKGSDEMVSTTARWHIGSITKSFTATLLMRLAARDVLDFDANLAELLPKYASEMHPDWHNLTLTEILSHSAGLPENFKHNDAGGANGSTATEDRLEFLRAVWGRVLPGKRGRYKYSNLGYVLAGFIAETRAGGNWQSLIRDEIAAPLNLNTLGFGPPMGADDPWGHQRRFFRNKPMDPQGQWPDNPVWLGPAGTLHMSIGDLLRWGQVHMHACRGEMPEFLSRSDCARLHEPISNDYALGWQVMPLPNLEDTQAHIHDGSNTFWVAVLLYVPKRDMVLAVAINTGSIRKAHKASQALGNAVLGIE